LDFFAHQGRSRRRTRLLVVLFALALVSIVAVVDLVAIALPGLGSDPEGIAGELKKIGTAPAGSALAAVVAALRVPLPVLD
jgi:hypothetical protein